MMPSHSVVQILLCILAMIVLMRPGRSPFRRDKSGKGGFYGVALISGALAFGATRLFVISADGIRTAFPSASPLWLFSIPFMLAFLAGIVAHRKLADSSN
jgi:hypothetical protein